MRVSVSARKQLAPFSLLILLVCIPLGALYFRGAASDLLWGITHHWTTSINGVDIRLPFGWRKEQAPADQHTIKLRNSLRELPEVQVADIISIREAQAPFDPVEMAQQSERSQTHFMTPGDRLEPTPKDAFLQDHYLCSDIMRERGGLIRVDCFDKAGRWQASLRGRDQGITDMSVILRSVGGSGLSKQL